MNILTLINSLFNRDKEAVVVSTQKIQAKRMYDAGKSNRLTTDWLSVDTSNPDEAIKSNLRVIRNRAREISVNDGYGAKFLALVRNNVVGPDGFTLQVKAQDPNGTSDTYANELLEDRFWDWGMKNNCTIDRSLSFRGVQEMLVTQLARDGECVIRKVYRNDLKYGFAIQILEPDLLDEDYDAQLQSGNKVRMGVEIDAWNRPVAYHFKQEGLSYTPSRIRIPASEIIHLFRRDRPTQHRGLSWFTPVLANLKILKGYNEAAVINARVGASKMGFLVSVGEGAAQYTGDGTDSDGNIITDVSPGVLEVLPQGMDFKQFNPDYPHAQYEMFVKAVLKGIASGLGVSYNTLSSDLESVNYSSIRAGVDEERELWKNIQAFLIEHFLNEVFESWLHAGIEKEVFGTLPVKAKFDKFNSPQWTGKRWKYVNPVDDITANVTAIENGLKTKIQVLAEQGVDYEEHLIELKKQRELDAEYGNVEKAV